MLAAIKGADFSINMETYIFWSGSVGAKFTDALIERAHAGIPVRLLFDAIGSEKLEDDMLSAMREAGIEIQMYHPISPMHFQRLNNRTHRKLLVVDGKIGFTGGVGIADPWLGDGLQTQHWRDMHFRVEGPVVAQLQTVFNDNWIKVTGQVLNGPTYYPALEPAGEYVAQMFSSSPSGGAESMHLMYLLSIASARETIDLAAAYFVPDSITSEALEQALSRGIRLRLLLPSDKSDSKLMRLASRGFWSRLLERGAEIYLYEPAMLHSKMMIVDNAIVSVGSTNFDSRSFSLNDEANLNVYGSAFAGHMTAIFEGDLARSNRVQAGSWHRRPWHQKILENVVSIVNSQL
jgi:cardiolipin synthase